MQKTNGSKVYLPPLADPIFGAIFADVEVAGLAMESLISSVLESDNEKPLGKIISITPQRVHDSPHNRGVRVDVETITKSNESAITEVQLSIDKNIMIRNLLTSSNKFVGSADKGDTVAQMAKKLPRVIHINFLGYVIRAGSRKLVEPYKIMYTNMPAEVAIPHFSGYNIQLPNVYQMEPDFEDSLYAWCYIMYTAHLEEKSAREVAALVPELKEYLNQDPGLAQFCERHKLVSSDPATREKYMRWVLDVMKYQGELEGAEETGFIKGEKAGLKKGIEKGIERVALKMLKKGRSLRDVSADTGLSVARIKKLKAGK